MTGADATIAVFLDGFDTGHAAGHTTGWMAGYVEGYDVGVGAGRAQLQAEWTDLTATGRAIARAVANAGPYQPIQFGPAAPMRTPAEILNDWKDTP
jgi:selenocysteine lyase/cysteine desulfurase